MLRNAVSISSEGFNGSYQQIRGTPDRKQDGVREVKINPSLEDLLLSALTC